MRVLFCQTVPYLPDDRGGGLTNTDALCRAIRARGGEAAVLCARGRAVRWPFAARSESYPYRIFREAAPLDAISDACRAFRPDVAVVQFADAPAIGHRLSEQGVKVVVYQHDVFAAAHERAGAALYFACSQTVAMAMPRDLGAPVVVLPVLVDPEAFRVPRTGQKITLINPIPRKGVEITFALAARRPDLEFMLVEAWRLRSRVRDYLHLRAAHHGNVVFRKAVDDVREVYQQTRLVLAPSLGLEAWGRIVSEAQVSGIPALVSDSGGLPEALGGGGIVVPRDAPLKNWSEALDRILDTTAYEDFSAAALAHAARPDFQPADVVERFMSALKDGRR